VSGAVVKTDIFNPSSSLWLSPTGTTGADGWALFSHNTSPNNPLGTYTITVNTVTKTGATYNASANVISSTTFTLQ